jgi:hypothetical protein
MPKVYRSPSSFASKSGSNIRNSRSKLEKTKRFNSAVSKGKPTNSLFGPKRKK